MSKTGGQVGGLPSAFGSASPTGATDPFQHDSTMTSALLDPGAAASAPANRQFVPGTAGGPGTLTIRRTITNTTNTTFIGAKVRITSMSEVNGAPYPGVTAPARKANLRVVAPATATSSIVTTAGTVTVQNLGVDAPNVGVNGGLNSTLLIPGGVPPNSSVNVAITFQNDSSGTSGWATTWTLSSTSERGC